MLRIFAVLCDLILISALVMITKRVAKGKSVSISEHAASSRWSYWLFATTLTVCGSVLSLYLLFDLGVQFKMSIVFYGAAVIGWVCLLLTAWIAESKKKRFKNPHWVSAHLLSAMMALMLACVAASSQFYLSTRLLAGVFACWYVYSLYLVVFNDKSKVLNYYMLIQYSNIISFTTLVLAASFFD